MSPAADKLASLAARYWAFECSESPFTAILAGVPSKDVMIFREGSEDHARRNAAACSMLAELDAIAVGDLAGEDIATHTLLHRELHTIRERHAVRAHLRPWLLPVGPDFSIVHFANTTSIGSADDARLYVDRLEASAAYLDQIVANMLEGHAAGIRYPFRVLKAAAANARAGAGTDVHETPWFGPFRRSVVAARPEVADQADRAVGVIRETLLPALGRYADALDGALAEDAREGMSCVDAPDGEAYYLTFVKHFTTTAMSPEEIHALGLAEVDRIEAEMASVAKQAGFDGDVSRYRQYIATDPQFVAADGETLRRELESLCKRVDRLIPAYFSRIPRITYGVDIIPPALAPVMPPAYAQPGPADGSSAGIFWANGIVEKCPRHIHPALVVHEAWPGHLMHLALLQELDHLPEFRRHGAVKYTPCIEGWALYCEHLAEEMGLYTTPHEHYGWLEMEMWRACRLVVDTGLHWYRWSREQAVAYMRAKLSLDLATIEAEVDRYAALPGQALAYQIGNLKFRALRRRAEAALGARFSVRGFHEVITTAGAVTLTVLEDVVERWIAQSGAEPHTQS